jgi:hypothetical protein
MPTTLVQTSSSETEATRKVHLKRRRRTLPLLRGFTPEAVVPHIPEVLYIACVGRVHVLYDVQQQYIASTDAGGVVVEVEAKGLLRVALSRSPKQVADIATSQHENLQEQNLPLIPLCLTWLCHKI